MDDLILQEAPADGKTHARRRQGVLKVLSDNFFRRFDPAFSPRRREARYTCPGRKCRGETLENFAFFAAWRFDLGVLV